ncbi:WD40-repeat-containing domain protein [Phlyctochytrium arcticum]|nr:WD40-repeat-containing domain protein [Phlyctochytrium arcticum]
MPSGTVIGGGGYGRTNYLPPHLYLPAPTTNPPPPKSNALIPTSRPASHTLSLSERPLICLDIHPATGRFVVASSDHALYLVSVTPNGPQLDRTLYNKRHGHSEWVTCCASLPSGRVVSGGMDSRVLLWDARAPTSQVLSGHEGSITSVKADAGERLVVSSAYDGTVRAWDVGRGGKEMGIWGGDVDGALAKGDYMATTRNPVLDFVWDSGSENGSRERLLTCTKDGRVMVFDMAASKSAPLAVIRGHSGPVRTVLVGKHPQLITSAGNLDGCLRTFDLRIPPEKGRCVRKVEGLHAGGVTGLIHCGDEMLVSSGGADGTIKFLDRKSLKTIHVVEAATQYPVGSPAASAHGMTIDGSTLYSTWGNGRMLAHNIDSHALMAEFADPLIKNALRGIHVTTNDKQGTSHLVGVGDDGLFAVWDLS